MTPVRIDGRPTRLAPAAPAVSFQSKRIGNAPDRTGRVHHKNVEPDAGAAPFRMRGQQDISRREQPRLLSPAKRRSSGSERRPRLDLDQRQKTGFLGNDIDLAGLGTQPPAVDCPTVLFQGQAGGIFGGHAARMRGRPASHRRAASSAANVIAAIKLDGSAIPLPAMSNAVPWSGDVRTIGKPSVTFTP